jgi:uncharacterized protein YbjT (DUF2867 family)
MIVVIGGTGFMGSRVVAKLGADGHEAVAASRNTGVNTVTGEGLADALAGASIVIDVSNVQGLQDAEMLEFFETSTQNLLAAAAPGVRHYVALSVVGCDGLPDSGYLRAKVAQADLIENSVVPYSMIYPNTISGDLDRRASTSSRHVESGFPFAGSEPSTSSESHTGQALSIIYTPDNRRDLEEPGLRSGKVGRQFMHSSHGGRSRLALPIHTHYGRNPHPEEGNKADIGNYPQGDPEAPVRRSVGIEPAM